MTEHLAAGPANSLADVPGLTVGHAQRVGGGWLTGTTVVLGPAGGVLAGVDVRGGGPGTRETDLLDPRNAVERANAIVLSGGSAYGLAAADGVMRRLGEAGFGIRVGPMPHEVVPIVPAAILFDLGRGGMFTAFPDPELGRRAHDEAGLVVRQGCVGAGTGAVAGGLKGGTGTASVVLPGGEVVAALAVVNAVGSVFDPLTGELYGARYGLPGEFEWLRPPSPADVLHATALLADQHRARPLNTTIGVVACTVPLTKAQCAKLAGVAQDGLARAIRPAHTMFDGDTIFGLSVTEDTDPVSPLLFHDILSVAADCFSRAIVHAVLSAESVSTSAGSWPAYLDAFGSADAG